MVERAVGNSFSLALIMGAVMTVAGVLSSDALLRLMATPPENFAMASTYLKINLAGIVLFYLGFLTNFILRGIGDTVTPLVFMSIGLGTERAPRPVLDRRLRAVPPLGPERGRLRHVDLAGRGAWGKHFLSESQAARDRLPSFETQRSTAA